MKRKNISKTALLYLIIGLMITTLTPVISRYVLLPDFIKGLLTGLGLTLEFIALVIQQRKKGMRCTATSH